MAKSLQAWTSARRESIDGTKSKGKAPKPSRGLQLAVYETIDGLGGANYKQLKKYLPAAITKANQVATKKQLDYSISNGLYRGYFIERNKHYYIAPIEIYQIRQAHIKKVKGKHTVAKKSKPTPNLEYVINRPFWHWMVVTPLFATWFVLGVVVGGIIF